MRSLSPSCSGTVTPQISFAPCSSYTTFSPIEVILRNAVGCEDRMSIRSGVGDERERPPTPPCTIVEKSPVMMFVVLSVGRTSASLFDASLLSSLPCAVERRFTDDF